MNGKGDKRRPTDEKRFGTNYERIFKVKQCQQDNPHITKRLKNSNLK